MSELSYDKEIVDEMIEQQNMSFDKLDTMLYHLPKDINKIIFSYYTPFCKSCDECCSLCRFYCMSECLRDVSKRDVCCNLEHKYLIINHNIIMNRKIIDIDINIAGQSLSDDELIIRA